MNFDLFGQTAEVTKDFNDWFTESKVENLIGIRQGAERKDLRRRGGYFFASGASPKDFQSKMDLLFAIPINVKATNKELEARVKLLEAAVARLEMVVISYFKV